MGCRICRPIEEFSPSFLTMTTLRHLLIVDVETTGIDFEENAPIEYGAILFDVEHRAVTHQFSALLPSVVPNGAEAVNGIPGALLAWAEVQRLCEPSIDYLQQLYNSADAVLAHNVEFDHPWLEPVISSLPLPWLCTLRDFRWNLPGLRATPSVIDLALAHGVPVWAAHRALTDCTYLAQVLAAREDIPALLQDAQTPQSLYKAVVSFADRDLAKAAGFQWQAHKPKAWTRYLRDDEIQSLPFTVERQ
jgi:DNA polymerase-3 subunit epsilon